MLFFSTLSLAHSNDDEGSDGSDEYEEESSNMDESLQNGPATLGCLTVKGMAQFGIILYLVSRKMKFID